MGPTLNGPFRDVNCLGSLNIVTIVEYGGDRLGPKYSIRYREVVEPQTWSVGWRGFTELLVVFCLRQLSLQAEGVT